MLTSPAQFDIFLTAVITFPNFVQLLFAVAALIPIECPCRRGMNICCTCFPNIPSHTDEKSSCYQLNSKIGCKLWKCPVAYQWWRTERDIQRDIERDIQASLSIRIIPKLQLCYSHERRVDITFHFITSECNAVC